MTTRGNKGTRDYPGSSVCNRVSVAAQSQRKCQWSARAVSCWINVRQACVDSRQLLSRDRLPALNDCRRCVRRFEKSPWLLYRTCATGSLKGRRRCAANSRLLVEVGAPQVFCLRLARPLPLSILEKVQSTLDLPRELICFQLFVVG
jgi:hypothetical protein